MTSSVKAKTIAKPVLSSLGLMVALACNPAAAEMSFGGNVELDTTMQSNAGGTETENFTQGGRVKLSASGATTAGSATLAGHGDILVKSDGTAAVDDMWFSMGRNNWNLKLGSFEGMETFSKGTDTVLNVLGEVKNYQGSAGRGRIVDDRGHIAFNMAASDTVNIELAALWGESEAGTDDETMLSGFRPAISADITDDLRIAASFESLENGDAEIEGVGVYVRYATDAFALKVNMASGEQTTGAVTDWESTTLNINVEAGNIGVGYHTSEDDGGATANTLYARYLIPNLMGSENTNAQIGLSLASADDYVNAAGVPTELEDEMALRLRFFHSF